MRVRDRLLDSDFKAGLALLTFPLVYGGMLIGGAIISQPPPRLDPRGHPYPTGIGEAVGYLIVFTLLAFLGHLLVFVAYRWRHPTWPLRALLGLQVLAALGSVGAFKFLYTFSGAFLTAPMVTLGVYRIAELDR